ncbi:MAG: hypothetical protein AB1553_04560 [Nitrospirota bacterium]
MATSNMRGISAANGFVSYCKDKKGKTERVKYEYSTFTNQRAEMKLMRGRKYNGIDFRVSFDPNDRKLTEEEFKAIAQELAERYLGSRPFVAVLHSETDHEHIHFVSTYLDENGKCICTKGPKGDEECKRRQEIVDRVCRKYNLSTLPRNENGYNSKDGIPGYQYKKERITKAEKQGKQPEKAALRRLIDGALSIESLEPYIVREKENSLTFEYKGKRYRLDSFDKRLKNRADLESRIRERTMKKQSSNDRLRRSEQLFLNRLSRTVEALSYKKYNRNEIQGIADKVLQHRAQANDPSQRWEALKKMRSELDQIMTREQLRQIKNQMYQEKHQRYQSKVLRRVLRERNPIIAFVLSINVILSALAEAIKDRKHDNNVKDIIDHKANIQSSNIDHNTHNSGPRV